MSDEQARNFSQRIEQSKEELDARMRQITSRVEGSSGSLQGGASKALWQKNDELQQIGMNMRNLLEKLRSGMLQTANASYAEDGNAQQALHSVSPDGGGAGMNFQRV